MQHTLGRLGSRVSLCLLFVFFSGCAGGIKYYSDTQRATLYIVKVHNTILNQVEYSETQSNNKIAAASNVFGNCANANEASDADLSALCQLLDSIKLKAGPEATAQVEVLIPGTEASKKGGSTKELKPKDIQDEYIEFTREYADQQGARITLIGASKAGNIVPRLESGITEISFIRGELGKVKRQDKYCLRLTVMGKMVSKDEEIPIEINHKVSCKPVKDWVKDGEFVFRTVLADKLRSVSSQLIDEFSLLYRPDTEYKSTAFVHREEAFSKHYPDYVLAALKPALRILTDEEYHKLSGSDKVSTNWYFGIPITESTQPELSWEAFPLQWDANLKKPAIHIANIRYDLNIYEADTVQRSGINVDSGGHIPGKWVYKKTDLESNSHTPTEALQPCKKYFWTVRALFRMAGAARFTEWGGVYDFRSLPWKYRLKGSEYQRFVHPSRFYYIFQTPAESGGSCS
ncbi:MAG: hypothetical protein OEZ68_20225 [Gammaproteobacteria bacterium]|nr:hypothetical protein [Gammaproteobacteria bacterium]MDH5803131.1 hypothetical protein [Gammaproteobacteria bacterium]